MDIGPYNVCQAVTPSDVTDLPLWSSKSMPTRAIYVGGAGNVAAVMPDGTAVSFLAAVAGFVLPLTVRRINAAGTTATALVALYQI